jgi:demethylmenaquinone methyltransferase/2-methoxy-6-polyprenyl-1,4-benzoquinol methylase
MENNLTNIELNQCFKNPELKKNHNKKLFSFISSKYNLATRILSFGQDQRWKSKLIKLLPYIENPICLDLACGTGDITFKVAQNYKKGTVIGLDITQSMIDQAIKLNNFKNIEFVCQDMCQTNFENDSFDIVTGGYALRNSPDLKKTLMEIHRITKPNGTIAVLDFCKFNNFYIQKIQYAVLKFWGSLWGIILHGNYTTYSYIAQSLKYYPTNSEFEKLIKDFGFEAIHNKKLFLGTLQILVFKKI